MVVGCGRSEPGFDFEVEAVVTVLGCFDGGEGVKVEFLDFGLGAFAECAPALAFVADGLGEGGAVGFAAYEVGEELGGAGADGEVGQGNKKG